ncbi:hypothetical protein COV19_02170 [Candidatus Woesearchaeota archaeon CG10_big_fil_rev_8_21_14_0_10_44_13]|nr:MAG: hypothetical protein COV19_02170 [Candidatus Woesearchaeota archaeon CG10_big_fil_rev_8_21_14_0_10_44_13]
MPLIDPSIGVKIVYILGITNVIGLALVLSSCRCMLGMRPSAGNSAAYMRFYSYHCYYWWFFIISVLMHATTAILSFGNPFF